MKKLTLSVNKSLSKISLYDWDSLPKLHKINENGSRATTFTMMNHF